MVGVLAAAAAMVWWWRQRQGDSGIVIVIRDLSVVQSLHHTYTIHRSAYLLLIEAIPAVGR